MTKAANGLDNQGLRLKGVGKPTAADDGVPRAFVRSDLPVVCNGLPGANEVLAALLVPADLTDGLTLPVNLAGTIGRAFTAAKAAASISITRTLAGSSTETTVASISFAAGGTIPTMSQQTSYVFAPGDLLRVRGPATQDATLADIFLTIVLKR